MIKVIKYFNRYNNINNNTMKVKLKRDEQFNIQEVEIPEGVIKEWTEDYQDSKGYYKYYYISKKGNKKECEIIWVR